MCRGQQFCVAALGRDWPQAVVYVHNQITQRRLRLHSVGSETNGSLWSRHRKQQVVPHTPLSCHPCCVPATPDVSLTSHSVLTLTTPCHLSLCTRSTPPVWSPPRPRCLAPSCSRNPGAGWSSLVLSAPPGLCCTRSPPTTRPARRLWAPGACVLHLVCCAVLS